MIEQDCLTRLAWTEERVAKATTLDMVQALNDYSKKQHHHKRKTSLSTPHTDEPTATTQPQQPTQRVSPPPPPPTTPPPHAPAAVSPRVAVSTTATVPSTPPHPSVHDDTTAAIHLSIRRYHGLSKRISHKKHALTLCISSVDKQRLHTMIQQEQHMRDSARHDMTSDQDRMQQRVEQLGILLVMYTNMSNVDENEATWTDNDMSNMTEIQETIQRLQETLGLVGDALLLA